MQCWHCGATVREGAKLCIYCGAKLGDEQTGRGLGERPGRSRAAPSRGYVPHDQGDGQWMPAQDDSVEAPAHAPRAAGRSARDGDDDTTSRGARRATGRPAYDDQGDESQERLPALPPARRGTGGSPSRGADDRYDDPLNDPRAPRNLRGPSASQGGRSRDERDMRRHGGRDESYGRGRAGRQGGYGDEPSPGRGHEYEPSHNGHDGYDGRTTWDAADGQSAAYDAYEASRAYPDDGYRDPRGHGDAQNGRGRAPRDDARERRQARQSPPMDDSWGMPAIGADSAAGTGWTDESAAWGVAPSEQYPAAPVRTGRPREAQRSGAAKNTARKNTARKNTARRKGTAPSSGKSTTPAVLGILLLLAAIAAGGVILVPRALQNSNPTSATPHSTFIQYTPGPTPTPLPNYQLYQSAASAYIVTYPKDWTLKQSTDGGDYLDTFAPKGDIPYLKVERATGFDVLQDSQIVDAEKQGGEQAGETFAETNGAAAIVHIGGEPWTRREFDVTTKDGSKLHMAILGSHHAGHGYAIVFAAAQGDFAALNTSTLQSILASFRFVG